MLESVKQRYPTFSGLSTAFSSSLQPVLLSDLNKAYSDKSPTIGDLDRMYEYGASALWVKTQLTGIDFVSSTKEDADMNALTEFSNLFSRQYHSTKLTEFLLFIARFKLGQYGKFYGYFDMLTIGEAFKKFIRERAYEIDSIERRKNNQKYDNPIAEFERYHEPADYIQVEIDRHKSKFKNK
ncbi:DUF6633 family protein [Bacteroides sp.]|uniref:DUF6633 family protein n=1 Tax=Bacteroides sp. TaxID=29523 RepID=UPI00260E2672|nr:DUF6633 family protein [Bacteroides sp.]